MSITEQRLAPHWDWSDMNGSEHFVQFYDGEAFLVRSLRGYIGTALQIGDAAVVVARKSIRDALDAQLRDDHLDVDALAASGRYVSLDASETLATFMVDRRPDAERFSQVVGGIVARAAQSGRTVRVFGEMVAILWAEGNHDAALQLEDLWNDLGRNQCFTLFCGYPMEGFDGDARAYAHAEVCARHAKVLPDESYSALDGADERLRAIAQLQQRARSLEAEIANRKAKEDALRASEAALQQSLHLRDEFLSAVSHDLKTPLTVLKGHAQLLMRRVSRGNVEAEAVSEGLTHIEYQARRMTELIDELLDVARLQAGEDLQLDRTMVDLIPLVQQEVACQVETTTSHPIVVTTAEMTLVGWWDRARLRRVIENLISNAIKYSPDGGAITVALARERGPDREVAVMSVADQGIGIEPEDLPHIFEPFYRGQSTDGAFVGSGLGLAGVRQIVERHGGTVTVESAPAAGSTFSVRLPIILPTIGTGQGLQGSSPGIKHRA
jgi:signal transduction histidine kinase